MSDSQQMKSGSMYIYFFIALVSNKSHQLSVKPAKPACTVFLPSAITSPEFLWIVYNIIPSSHSTEVEKIPEDHDLKHLLSLSHTELVSVSDPQAASDQETKEF